MVPNLLWLTNGKTVYHEMVSVLSVCLALYNTNNAGSEMKPALMYIRRDGDVLLGQGWKLVGVPGWKNNVHIPWAMMMETACFSETLACTNRSLRRFNPKERHWNFHRRENLKSHKFHVHMKQHSSVLVPLAGDCELQNVNRAWKLK